MGTFLCLWSLAAFYAPATVPGLPQLFGPTNTSPQSIAELPGVPIDRLPSQRVVSPIEGADVVTPEAQLHANVWHVAFALCVGVASSASMAAEYPGQFEGAPLTLEVGPDRVVTGGDATYSSLPADMTLEYSGTPAGAYSLTVRDAQSGLGVGCDSASNQLSDR